MNNSYAPRTRRRQLRMWHVASTVVAIVAVLAGAGIAYAASLEPNGTRDGDDLVADFLGRPASVQNYLKMRGLG